MDARITCRRAAVFSENVAANALRSSGRNYWKVELQ